VVGDGLRVAGDAVVRQARVAVDRAVDRGKRLRAREDQRHAEPGQHGSQGAVDQAGVLAHPHLLALGALEPPGRGPVADRGFPDRARDVAGQIGDGDLRRRALARDLDQPHRSLGEGEHQRGLREGDRSQQGERRPRITRDG
jgi:hypothetical protein